MVASGGNLVPVLSGFVGREDELAQLLELRTMTRALTLVGPGGIGKSSLASRLQSSVQSAFADGVWHIDVDTLGRPGELPLAVGEVRLTQPLPGRTWMETVAEWLDERQILLILDNCDRRVAECAELGAYLLRNCSGIEILATSREPLGIEGEVVWRVPPLGVPRLGATRTREIQASDAVRLFVTRLRLRQPDFVLGEHNARTVAGICQRVRGWPLALEIVAGNVPRLGLDRLAYRLDAAFALRLTNGGAGQARLHSLRATVDGSFALLSESEQLLMERLAVFVGGWTLDDAEAVCAYARLPVPLVAELLERLASKSLISIDHQLDPARYRFIDFVREYAAELLRTSGEEPALRRRHAANVLRLATQVPLDCLDANHAARMEHDQGNLRAALRWALHASEIDLALDLAIAGYSFWYRRGRFAEGQAWLTRCLNLPVSDATQARRRAVIGCLNGRLALLTGNGRSARAMVEAARRVHIQLGNQVGIVLAALCLAEIELWAGNPSAAWVHSEESRAALQHVASERDVPTGFQLALLTIRARIAAELDDDRRAGRLATEAAMLARTQRNQFWLARALHAQGLVAERSGQPAAALWLVERAVAVQRAEHDTVGVIESLCALGRLRFASGSEKDGLNAFAEAALVAERTGDRLGLALALDGAARGLASRQPDVAARLAAACETLRETFGLAAAPRQRRRATWLTSVRTRLGVKAYRTARATGRGLTRTEAVVLLDDLARGQMTREQPPDERLTHRERDVAQLVAQGMTNQQIATRLTISVGTVRSHVDHILQKLEVHSRAQVAVWALQQGALTL